MRVYVYVDGFNLYYRALRCTPHKWLNLDLLARRLVRPGDSIDLVRYFSARVKARAGDPDAPRRQQIYLSASSRFSTPRRKALTSISPFISSTTLGRIISMSRSCSRRIRI